jgi:hypothetical protein
MPLLMAIIDFYGGYWIAYGGNQMSYGENCELWRKSKCLWRKSHRAMAKIIRVEIHECAAVMTSSPGRTFSAAIAR